MSRPLRYVGDISHADAAVLTDLAAGSQRILEYGVGASTQVFAQSAGPGTRIVSLDRDPRWIDRTRVLLDELTPGNGVELELFDRLADLDRFEDASFDLILDDGEDDLRLEFGLAAWRLLEVGGRFVFHDTRRRRDIGNVLTLTQRFYREIETIHVNASDSNLTIIHKGPEKLYENWNNTEGRESWQVGDEPMDVTLRKLRAGPL